MGVSDWVSIGLGVGIPVITFFAALWAKSMRDSMRQVQITLEGKLKLMQQKQSQISKSQTSIWNKLSKHSVKLGVLSENDVRIMERLRAMKPSTPEMDMPRDDNGQ